MSSKINDFISQEIGLRNHITDTANALNSISHSAQTSDRFPDNAVGTIEEFLERECRKCDVIVFNLKESTTADADKDSFIELCRSSLKLEVEVAKTFQLGKAAPDKTRHWLITTTMVDSKVDILDLLTNFAQLTNMPMFIFHLTELGRKGRALGSYEQSSSKERIMVNQIKSSEMVNII